MKLATFAIECPTGLEHRVGVLDSETLIDVTAGYKQYAIEADESDPAELARSLTPPTMIAFLRRGDAAMEAAADAVEHFAGLEDPRTPEGARIRYPLEDVRLASPVPRPNSIRDFATFEQHIANSPRLEEVPQTWYDVPIYYKGNPDAVVGPDQEVRFPSEETRMDYELEVAAVVGKRANEVSAEDASEYIAGYTIFNDFSARDVQMREMTIGLGPSYGKDFANALGPYLVTPDEIDIAGARMSAAVNGETWSEGRLDEMYHTFEDLVAYLSRTQTLHPGDVLGSGTPGGGCGLGLDRFLGPGDTVELTVEGIGTLRNTVKR